LLNLRQRLLLHLPGAEQQVLICLLQQRRAHLPTPAVVAHGQLNDAAEGAAASVLEPWRLF
jgi:hypothetical protein